jgi:4-diphosphocytidyl-2-C-methyl-D-erythritol kinase
LAQQLLVETAARIGADVPFFLSGGTARGRGRGDRIEALPPLATVHLLLGCPPFGSATAEVYRRAAERLTLPGVGVSLAPSEAHKWPENNDFAFMVNDLERVAFEARPELRGFRDALLGAGAKAALLSGSGSTVYGVFREARQASSACAQLESRFADWRLLSTRTVEAAAHVVPQGDQAVGRGP